LQPINQLKNLKFLRFVYPIKHYHQKSKINFAKVKRNKRTKKLKEIKKRYVYIGLNPKRLSINNKSNLQNKIRLLKKLYISRQNKKIVLRNKKLFLLKKAILKQKLNNYNINTYPFYKKPDFFLRKRRKLVRDFAQNKMAFTKRQLLMRQFLPILSLFIKYINPQILADHIAKEFEKTKKHRNLILAIKTALRSLKFAKGIGYRIAIIGRINSSKKSRTIYLKKRTLIRQNFEKKVNYATAQAKARIGSFGIKV
jgi:hypothetical protein